jgi:hypothetical protein
VYHYEFLKLEINENDRFWFCPAISGGYIQKLVETNSVIAGIAKSDHLEMAASGVPPFVVTNKLITDVKDILVSMNTNSTQTVSPNDYGNQLPISGRNDELNELKLQLKDLSK